MKPNQLKRTVPFVFKSEGTVLSFSGDANSDSHLLHGGSETAAPVTVKTKVPCQ